VTAGAGGQGRRPLRVVVAGGGTAGHVEPAMSLADALRRRLPDCRITALGTERGLEARLVPERGYQLRLIPRVPMPRRPTVDLVTLPWRAAKAVRTTVDILRDAQADVVVGFGGYVSFPAYLAARRVGCPIVVHEANVRPGMANRVGARLTRHVAVSTPAASLPHATVTGIPLRRSVATLDRATARGAARKSFGLLPDAPTLLVFGGSQGARSINEAVSSAAGRLRARGIQVLHAAGEGNRVLVGPEDDQPPYIVLPYLHQMADAYAAADLAVCRSGAMTCAELSAVGLPGVFVPYPHSNGEQEVNAEPLVRAGGGVLIKDHELTAERVVDEVTAILLDPARLAAMSGAVAGLGHRDADERLVDLTLDAAGWSL
jgi:UDP-N-acetylglucosamine--N-acetylmuramyl-(pentapeptide) pyrophosphoryl-undecaprenol N-acetylglucosamine transferase